MQKWYNTIIINWVFFFEHFNHFGWREQVDTISTRPVNQACQPY